MTVISKKWKLFLYAFGAFGVNLLNLMVGSYLCSALIASGFGSAAIANQTFEGIDLVIPAVWSVFGIVAKILDGVIDIPMAQLTDKLRSRWGRRRPAIIMGLIPMIMAYCCFLIVPNSGVAHSVGNTIYFFVMLVIFYSSYTLTMVTYYATFTEIVDNERDRRFLTNTKSIADIFYFILGFALVPMMLKGINIRWVALIVLPLVLLMLIPIFFIKEKSTLEQPGEPKEEKVNLFQSLGYTLKNKDFVIWMIVYSFMTIGLQLFLSGINEYFSVSGMSMIYVMMASFGPVPLTFMLYNWLIDKKGFKFAYQFTLLVFALAMLAMFGISYFEGTTKLILSIVGGVISSFSIGAMFAVAYSIPSQLASDDEKKTGISHGAMYFAVQGLFSGVAAGIAGYGILTALKVSGLFGKPGTYYMTVISAVAVLIAFVLAFFLPKSIALLGKKGAKESGNPEDVIVDDTLEAEAINEKNN